MTTNFDWYKQYITKTDTLKGIFLNTALPNIFLGIACGYIGIRYKDPTMKWLGIGNLSIATLSMPSNMNYLHKLTACKLCNDQNVSGENQFIHYELSSNAKEY